VKLMSTFHDRIGYVTHIRNLQLYLKLGMKLLKIHRVLMFEQTEIIAPYIEKTTAARKSSTTKFEMDMFKKLVSKTIKFSCFILVVSLSCFILVPKNIGPSVLN